MYAVRCASYKVSGKLSIANEFLFFHGPRKKCQIYFSSFIVHAFSSYDLVQTTKTKPAFLKYKTVVGFPLVISDRYQEKHRLRHIWIYSCKNIQCEAIGYSRQSNARFIWFIQIKEGSAFFVDGKTSNNVQ